MDTPEVSAMVSELEEARRTGRPGYGSRALVGACVVRSVYALSTWTRTARLIAEHEALRAVIGGAPSRDALYRFTKKLQRLRAPIDRCLSRLVRGLRERLPGYGRVVAVDSTDLPAYANGQRYRYRGGPERQSWSDPDATWGHRSAISTRRGGGFYGYKTHMAACALTGLPVAWVVETAKAADMRKAEQLLDRLPDVPETAIMDAGYDYQTVIDSCRSRGTVPVVAPRRNSGTHGGRPAEGRGNLYRLRGAVEREFGRLKNQLALVPLRTRGIERVRLHTDLVLLTRLGEALLRN